MNMTCTVKDLPNFAHYKVKGTDVFAWQTSLELQAIAKTTAIYVNNYFSRSVEH
jgi:hypothetical protein